MLISLSFPKEDLRDEVLSRAFLEEQGRLTSRRALLDLCIAREESREDAAGTLRLISPRAACQREFSDRRFSSGF